MNHSTIQAGERPDVGETCPNPCGWVLAVPYEQRRDLDARLRLALLYQDSAIVALRHHAPVGHFFGVPSAGDLGSLGAHVGTALGPVAGRCEPALLLGEALGVPHPSEALPGMSMLALAVAGRTIGPGTSFVTSPPRRAPRAGRTDMARRDRLEQLPGRLP